MEFNLLILIYGSLYCGVMNKNSRVFSFCLSVAFSFFILYESYAGKSCCSLEFSKDNKQELEKVLSYYKGQSSKLKAAQF